MKTHKKRRMIFASMLAASFCIVAGPAAATPVAASAQSAQKQNSETAAPAAAFEARVKDYVRMREGLEEKLPTLSKEATPEQIEAHKKVFMEQVRAARAGAKQGQLFTPDVAAHIRATIKNTYRPRERAELRKTVLEAETQGVPLRINYPYPDSKELVEMPPTLLLNLPQLPKQVKYRFVGRHLLLVDRENTLIIDYMPDALP